MFQKHTESLREREEPNASADFDCNRIAAILATVGNSDDPEAHQGG